MSDKEQEQEKELKENQELIEKIAQEVTKRKMTAPAIFLLESGKPLSFIGSQFLTFLSPIVQTIFSSKYYDRITKMLEDRNNIEKLICRIEELEEEQKDKRE